MAQKRVPLGGKVFLGVGGFYAGIIGAPQAPGGGSLAALLEGLKKDTRPVEVK